VCNVKQVKLFVLLLLLHCSSKQCNAVQCDASGHALYLKLCNVSEALPCCCCCISSGLVEMVSDEWSHAAEWSQLLLAH
jgi:hypothetical protein